MCKALKSTIKVLTIIDYAVKQGGVSKKYQIAK